MAKYLKSVGDWQIYVIPEAYQMTQHVNVGVHVELYMQLIDRYIAVHPTKHWIIDDVTLESLEAGIHEADK
jgi:hypothetical protein